MSAAASYARRGWPVFPVAQDKRPLTRNGLKDASTDPAQIARWRALKAAGVAIRTGNGLVVLDVDGDEGADSLREREREYSELPHTVRAITPGGGAHHYFASTTAVPCSAGKVGPSLDIRGEGGYVVAPRSLHPTGRRYEWDVPPGDAEPAPIPAWLVALAAPDPRPAQRRPANSPRIARDDVLLTVDLADAVEELTGVAGGRGGMINCPLPGHDDKTPSFHITGRLFYCHGCGRGGTIYDLGAELWGHPAPLRGDDFKAVRYRLLEELSR